MNAKEIITVAAGTIIGLVAYDYLIKKYIPA
jgi:hypothetical protein